MWPVLIDLVIPTIAILVPTGIAIWLARRERTASRQDREQAQQDAATERRYHAATGVIVGLAHFISADPREMPLHERLAELRGRIAVYRAWIEVDDISGDWLALKHTEGMRLWSTALSNIEDMQGLTADTYDDYFGELDAPRRWAQTTIDTFSMWLSGHVGTEKLRAEGAALIEQFGPEP